MGLVLAAGGSALAQGVEAHGMVPWGSRAEGAFALPSARLLEQGSWEVALSLAHEGEAVRAAVPLANARGGAQASQIAWISDRQLANLQLTASPLSRFELFAGLPVLLNQNVNAVSGVQTPVGSASSIGDAYATARFALLEPLALNQRGYQWTMQGGVGLPTGDETAAFGDETARFNAATTVTYESTRKWTATGHLGFHTGRSLAFADQLFGNRVVGGVAGAYRHDAFQFSLEAISTLAVTQALPQTTPSRVALEFLGGVRYFRELFFVDAAAGVAPLDAGGIPRWRVQAALGTRGFFAPKAAVAPDLDQDGVAGEADRCPTQPEDLDGFEDEDGCPDVDNDADGVIDGRDACPMIAEDLDGVADQDGCPEKDADADGVVDEKDGCPLAAEDFDGFEDEDGCPEAGAPDQNAVFRRQALREEAVFFETGKTALDSDALVTLKQIARLILRNPGVVVITGHADDQGTPERNDELSLERAKSVATKLAEAGIPADRLRPRGAGQREPIAGTIGLGRSINRSVTFDWAKE